MLTVAEVDLPQSLRNRLRDDAEFVENFAEFIGENLIGLRHPTAMAYAIIGPVLFAFAYYVAGFFTMLEVATTFSLSAAMFILGGWYVNREKIRDMYLRRTRARREAQVDLQIGSGQEVNLSLRAQPCFYEHEHGVICLADVGDGRTVYFDVDCMEDDPRWFLYINGDMHRVNWSWLKLLGSGSVTEFKASGKRLASIGDTPFVEAPDSWEAISLALGEPEDGDIIEKPLEEVKNSISRLL